MRVRARRRSAPTSWPPDGAGRGRANFCIAALGRASPGYACLMSDQPQTPPRDAPDNDEFGPSEAVGQGYPEESPAETQPDGTPDNPRKEQPQRDEG